MKVCVLHSSYDDSVSPLADVDTPLGIEPYLEALPEIDFRVVGLRKGTAVRELRHLIREGFDVFLNLCDGAWDDAQAGIEVVQTLERHRQAFTGAASDFYEPTREDMKRACHYYGVATPGYRFAVDKAGIRAAAEALRFPLIVKHPSSYSSIGMTRASRVSDAAALEAEAMRMIGLFGEVLIEEFIEGREFTVLVAENPDDPLDPVVFQPLEFVFPEGETFKHYDLKWIHYAGMRGELCTDAGLDAELRAMARATFLGLNGSSYGRCDIRVDAAGKPWLLEINPNCGVFYPPTDAGSADMILLAEQDGHKRFLELILRSALKRREQRSHNWQLAFDQTLQYGTYAARAIRESELIQKFEETPHVLVTRRHVERHWGAQEKQWFAQYAWPLTEEVWVMWHPRPEDWKPINHSCDPNAWLDGLNVVARRAIAEGEQITLDYATFCHASMPAFDCHCGAAICRGTVSGADSLRELVGVYGDHISDYVKTRRRAR